MSNATTQVHFAVVDESLEVSVPPALAPLDDFFETEIGTSEVLLGQLEHHIRHDRAWRFTGDACSLRLEAEAVTIGNNHTGDRMTLTRGELRALLTDLRAVLAG